MEARITTNILLRVPYYQYTTKEPENPILILKASLLHLEESKWMHIVLERFDSMATNVANTNRLQERLLAY